VVGILGPDEYRPRILSTGHASKTPVTELVIVGRGQLEALTELLDAFRKYKVELLGLESQSLPDTKLFVITAFTDMRSASCSLEYMLGMLRSLLGVDSAKGGELGGSAYERFLFPVVALDGSRLVVFTAENIAEVGRYFSTLKREDGNLVIFATGRQSGLALVRSLRRSHPGEFQNEMLGMVVDELRTSGWGVFSFDVSSLEAGSIRVAVTDPITMSVDGSKDSWLTYGMCAGVIEGIYGMVGNISANRTRSADKRTMKFKLVELLAGQTVDGLGR
jgi:hypothetical protein